MVKMYKKSFSRSDLWVSTSDKLSDFYASSCQKGESPLPLLVIRLILASLALAALVWSLVEGASPYWLLYLTNWGLLLVFLMLFSGLVVSIMALSKIPPESGELPWYTATYWFLFNIATTIAIMITALYWILLYDPNYEADNDSRRLFWLDVVTHGFNSCLVVSELVLSRTPMWLVHVYQPLAVGLWYAAFTGVYYAAGGTDVNGNPFIYEILDWRQGGRSGAIVAASTAGLLVIFAALWAVAVARYKLTESLLRTTSHDLPLAPPDNHVPRIV